MSEEVSESTIVSAARHSFADYKIVRAISEGPDGVVYKAQQLGSRRTVAIRVVKTLGNNAAAALAAAQRDLEHVKRLRHPHIATLLDTGLTDHGELYFISEFVRGVSFDEYAHLHKMPMNDWLTLFRKICLAVHHAHQHCVLHRDLWSGMVVIDGNVDPRVVGFGVAAVTETDLNIPQRPAPWRMPFRSPQQVAGNRAEVTVQSDVYALGVMLYELLTGKLPLDLKAIEGKEVIRAICETQPTPPSSIRRELAGDLEAIILKAIEKEPGDRYASALELARDIDDYQNGRTIRARPHTESYELGKFIGRNKISVMVVAAAMVMTSLLGLQAYLDVRSTSRQQLNAQQQKAAEAVAQSLAAGSHIERQRDDAVSSLRAEEKRRKHAETEADRLRAKFAEVEQAGASLSAQVQQSAEQTEQARRVSAFLANMFAAAPNDARSATTVAAADVLDRAAGRADEVFKNNPAARSAALGYLGTAYRNIGATGRAADILSRSVEAWRVSRAGPDGRILDTMNTLASTLFAQQKLAEAEPVLRELIRVAEKAVGPGDPKTMTALHNFGYTLYAQGKLSDAEQVFTRAADLRTRVLGADHAKTAVSSYYLGRALFDQGRLEDAEPKLWAAVRVLGAKQAGDNWLGPDARSRLGACMVSEGRFPEAERALLQGYKELRRVLGSEHATTRDAADRVVALYSAWGKDRDVEKWRSIRGRVNNAGARPRQ